MTTTKRDWIRTIGITGATLITLGALTMGGLFAANAAGVITLPAGRAGQMMGGRGGHDGMMGGRGGHDGMMGGRGGHGGMMGGRGGHGGMMGGRGGRDGMMQNGAQATAADAQVLQYTLHMLQQEQALASALGTSNPTAKAIAASRATDITTISNWLKTWYPNETIPTAPSASGTVAELRQMIQHHDLKLDKVATNGTFAHPELQQWLTDSLKQRAADVSALFGTQTS
jgi:hypothetical protein